MRLIYLIIFVLLLNVVSAQSIDTIPKTEYRQKIYHKSPYLAMLLSSIIPGSGQFYCENYIKSIMIIGAEGAFGYYAYQYHKDNQVSKRNNMLWWLATIKVISIADAYVTANMYKFNEQMRLSVECDNRSVGIGLVSKINIFDK